MELLKRIDLALAKSGKTRADLARELGISTQAITSLGRRRNATMKHENLVKAAHVLSCDLDWLASGKGSYRAVILRGDPKQAMVAHSEPTAREMMLSSVTTLFAQLQTDECRERVFDCLVECLSNERKHRKATA